jgi:hypothetical protein
VNPLKQAPNRLVEHHQHFAKRAMELDIAFLLDFFERIRTLRPIAGRLKMAIVQLGSFPKSETTLRKACH